METEDLCLHDRQLRGGRFLSQCLIIGIALPTCITELGQQDIHFADNLRISEAMPSPSTTQSLILSIFLSPQL